MTRVVRSAVQHRMPDFGEMRRAIRALSDVSDVQRALDSVSPMYDE
ncbi:hypothetical protein ACFQPA_03775 [Halomarina halobia]|uniref:Uncharacterized protein n=1 Tax=Halomarina halobia TaxID=3033386 RepID=A0ABD6A4J4_9EURY|nr:hypothetical protein [Halomarina sp. PSR21]